MTTTSERRRLLIVDNNEEESVALTELAISVGHEALSSWSGQDALKFLASNQFDLLLVDEFVADMYVGEFIEQVLRLSSPPRIGLMGVRQRNAMKYDRRLRGFPFLNKLRPEELVEVLRADFREQLPAKATYGNVASRGSPQCI